MRSRRERLPRRVATVLGRAVTLAAAVGVVLGAAPSLPVRSLTAAWARPGRVAGSAGGDVGVGRGAVGTSTFGRTGRGAGRGTGRSTGRDAGIGRTAVVRADRRLTDLGVREQLRAGAAGTYMAELLLRRDSSLTRWPDRPDRPLAVFVGSGAGLTGWRPEYVSAVASAFAAWSRAGLPLAFRLVDDSARADVRVGWVDRFAAPISGRTVWARDDRWWLVDGAVTLALHHNDGAPLDADQVRAIALHEVGHLLGLDHTADPENVMAPRVRVRELSSADVATARLLYSVPAGRVR